MGKGLNIHFSEIDVHMANAREKGLNITDHQGNANQNHGETSPRIH